MLGNVILFGLTPGTDDGGEMTVTGGYAPVYVDPGATPSPPGYAREWLENNRVRAFPFVRNFSGDPDASRALVDAVVVLPRSLFPQVNYYSIDLLNLEKYSPTGDPEATPIVHLGVTTAAGAHSLVFQSDGESCTFYETADSRFTTMQWTSSSRRISIKLVFVTAELATVTWPTTSDPAFLAPSTVIPQPEGISGVQAAGIAMDISRPIVFAEGYNCALTPPVVKYDLGELQDFLKISFTPGDGRGKFPNCDPLEPAIRRINGVGPDTIGRFKLTPDNQCLFERPYSETVAAPGGGTQVIVDGLILEDHCTACCTCSEMADTYNAIRFLLDRQQQTTVPHLDNTRYNLANGINGFYVLRDSGVVHQFLRLVPYANNVIGVQGFVVNGRPADISFDKWSFDFDPSATLQAATGKHKGPKGYFLAEDPVPGLGALIEVTTGPFTVESGHWRSYEFCVNSGVSAGTVVTVSLTAFTSGTGTNGKVVSESIQTITVVA